MSRFGSEDPSRSCLSKSLAKLASKYRKPNGLTAIRGREIHTFLKNIELEQAKLKDNDAKLLDMQQRIENNEKMFDAQQRIKQRFTEDLAKLKK